MPADSGKGSDGRATPSDRGREEDRSSSGSGAAGALVAGIVGAIIALGGAAALQAAGYLPSMGGSPAGQAATADFASRGDVTSLNQQVAALKQQVAASSGGGAGNGGAEVTALGQRIDALEKSSQASATDRSAALKPLQDATSAATSAAQGAQQTADKAGQSATKANDAATGAQQAAVKAQQTADGAQTAANEAGSAAQSAQKAADAADKAAKTAQDGVEATQASVGQIVDRIAAVEKNSQEARVALAAANLKSGIDSGEPFMSQLETYAKVSGSTETTDALRSYAADGVPSEQALAAAWPPVRDKISDALTPSDPTAPVQDQFFSGLKSLVQVRPSGAAPASDTGPQAVLSRLTAAIGSGDLQSFQTDWQKLPDPAKTASQDFEAKVTARLTAQKAVSGALSSALSLNGSGDGGAAPAPNGAASDAPGDGASSQPAPAATSGTQG